MSATCTSFRVRCTACTAAVLALVAAPADAQAPRDARPGIDFAAVEAPAANASAPFQAFVQANGGTWWSRWCPATGTPMELFGTGLPIVDWRGSSLDEARRHALAALATHGALLGLGGDEFREVIGASYGNVWTFTFEQFHRGVPVIGGRADVRIHTSGRIAFLGSQAFAVPDRQGLVPTIDAANAARIAWLTVGKVPERASPMALREPRLVLWGDLASDTLAPVFLCWEVPIEAVDGAGNGPIGRSYVDASTGIVRHYTDDKHTCGHPGCRGHGEHDHAATGLPPATYTVLGFARDGGSGITTPTNVPLPGLVINVPGIGDVVTDAAGQFSANLTSPTTVTVQMQGVHHALIVGGNAVTQTAVLQPAVPATIQLLSNAATDDQLAHTTCSLWVHRVNEWARSILGNSSQLAQADAVLPTVNIAQTCNAYYTSNTINFFGAGGGCTNTAAGSVIAHEWGHGLDDRYGGISQTQGLSEGWGDIISMYLLDDPTIGAGFFSTGGGIRTGLNGTQYPPPSEVHAAGEVFMGFAWLYRENLRTAFGSAAAINLSNANVIGSIAANAVDQPSAVTAIFLGDDNDGNLANGVPHYDQLEAACVAHNLPFPHVVLGTIAATTLTDTTVQWTPRPVLATVVPALGPFSQVRLHYHDGVAHQVPMIGTGAANQYQALLAGVPAPTTVTWHIEAVHPSGRILRQPSTGEWTYRVYQTRRIYFEDFDNGAVGWSHGATVGADDWEIATPNGSSGPGWRDPTVAASGAFCAGTDLTHDGLYSNAADQWLRSPPINCSGLAGIRLRFKRWLSIDSLPRDVAQVRINNVVYWINQPTAFPPSADTRWLQEDVRIFDADNQPAVVIEWRLQTDATIAYGGWNVDDVELVTTTQVPPLPNTMQLLPEMAGPGAPLTLTLQTQQAARPFLVVAGDSPGPTSVPGVPLLQLGGTVVSFGGATNASGSFTAGFAAPATVGLTGQMLYSQALTLDAAGQIVSTNAWLNLFTP